MKLKNLISFLLVSLLAVSLSACGNNPTGTASPATQGALSPTPDAGVSSAPDPSTAPAVTVAELHADLKDPASLAISPLLYGIFLEDINHAIDGGMYTELVKNRSFEFGSEASGKNKHGWTKVGDTVEFGTVNGTDDGTALNDANPNYAVITNTGDTPAGICNSGYYKAMPIKKGQKYNFSIFAKGLEGYTGPISIEVKRTTTLAFSGKTENITDTWQKYEISFTASEDIPAAELHIQIDKGSVAVDMVSLMIAEGYKGLPVRQDIGEALEALHPAFLRFPGGCVIEGKSLETQYSWKDSIGNGEEFVINGKTTVGDVAIRPQSHSIWNGTAEDPYYTTYGIGFYEYFELCEALNCEPLPVLNAGMLCPLQSGNSYRYYSINSDEFKQYVQDALDLVEFCRGDSTTRWGAVRTAMGHPEKFPLHYIAIGNEQTQNEYFEHYNQFCLAFENAARNNPEMFEGVELVISNGPASNNRYAYNYLESQDDIIVKWSKAADEHYYESAGWFFSNNKRYDKYSRNIKTKVFVGEYAAKSNTMQAALAEASFMTAFERNSDIVVMTCYAPLFANGKANQWTPDLIWFNNATVYGSPNYYVQYMFSNNVGSTYIPSAFTLPSDSGKKLSGRVGLASWETSVEYDNLLVVSNSTGETLYSNTFDSDSNLSEGTIIAGSWAVEDGKLRQKLTSSPKNENTGEAVYFGDTEWTDYTLTVDGTILSGKEGFLIPVCVKGKENNVFWNIGGWANTVSCLQIVSDNAKSAAVDGTSKSIRLKKNQVYKIKIVVKESSIQCYLDDELWIDYTEEAVNTLYDSVNTCDNGDIIIKLVNRDMASAPLKVFLDNFNEAEYEKQATMQILSTDHITDTNTFNNPEKIVPKDGTLSIGSTFDVELPGYSLVVIRIKKK